MPHPFLGLGFNSWTQKFSRGNVPAAVATRLEYVTLIVSSFTLRSTGTVDYEVDWGDGTTESLTTNAPTHTYSSSGSYTITVTPAEESTYRPYFNGAASDSSIESVTITGGSQLGTTLSDAWEGAVYMTSFGGDVDTSAVTNFINAWKDARALTSFPLIDTSSGTLFGGAWRGCTVLTSFPLIDTSSGTNFSNTWQNCSSLTSFPLIDTSSATILNHTWNNCTGLTSFPLIDTSNVTYMTGTWQFCTNLASVPLFDTSNVQSFRPFTFCSSLTTIPAFDVSSSNDFQNAFAFSGLTTFPANMFDTLSSGLFSYAFNGTWQNCSLTAQSIENILVSLDASGKTSIGLGIHGGSNAAKTTWSAAANTAYNNLITKGWTISYNA